MERLSEIPIRFLKGVGPQRAKIFNKAGVFSLEDLLYYFPRRYEDRTNFSRISELKSGEFYSVKATIMARGGRTSFRRRRFSIVELAVTDETGILNCVWFNQPYLKDYFKVGQVLILYGKVDRYGSRLQMAAPEFEIETQGDEQSSADNSLNIGRIVPVYTLPSGLGQRSFRRLIKQTIDGYLPKIVDFLPYNVRSRNNLLNLAKSIVNIHFPENPELQKEAYTRLSFEEFFLFQVPLALRKARQKQRQGIAHRVDGELVDTFISGLPFKLTSSQGLVLEEIKKDMASCQVMHRLLQGDVGSGKTVVATLAALMAVQGGYQAAFMAPTEILARQHFDKISYQLSVASNKNGRQISVGLLVSGQSKKEKNVFCRQVKEGRMDLVIGTHALLEESVEFKKLGLVVIDEQHKFGVGQRALLPQKGADPDVLIMTATPIPRTLAITLYGDLDVSVIHELPPGRPLIRTFCFSQDKQAQGITIVKQQLKQGRQAFIVYPVIEESFALDIAGAKKMYERFRKVEFKDFRLGLIHGKLKQEEQDVIMRRFRNRELDALISTTILEVGIDIPNATCMVVEHAERFGLSQLHQLRGRVGRGTAESFCILISDGQTQEAKARMDAMVQYSDGFRIAEEDLKIRGPGEFFGRRQHGLTELKIGNPLTQLHLLKLAREEAIKMLATDGCLDLRQNQLLKERLLQRFPEYKELMFVG